MDNNICPSCNKFHGYSNNDLAAMGTIKISKMLSCKSCGKSVIKLVGEDDSLQKRIGYGSTNDVNLNNI